MIIGRTSFLNVSVFTIKYKRIQSYLKFFKSWVGRRGAKDMKYSKLWEKMRILKKYNGLQERFEDFFKHW